MNLSPDVIRWIIIAMIVLIASIALHEFGHALMGHLLGDDTSKREGRLTLNPIAHADPIGTLMLPLVALIVTQGRTTGFGWGKPCPFNSARMTRKIHMRTGDALVAAAGPFMNLLLGTLICLTHVILIKTDVIGRDAAVNQALWYAVGLNFTLLLFNLIPAPPLDGGWIAARFIPRKHQRTWEKYAVYGPFVVMAFVMISPLAKIFIVPAGMMRDGLYNTLGSIFGM